MVSRVDVLEAVKGHSLKGVIIFMHGLGDTAQGWIGAMRDVQRRHLPNFKMVLPTARVMPITLNGGMPMPAWHDIHSLERIAMEDAPGLDDSVQSVHRLIDLEMEAGVPSTQIVLAGFSQGGALSLRAGFQSKHKLGAVLSLSGYLPNIKTFDQILEQENASTPALICHGTADDVVPIEASKQTCVKFKALGIPFQYREYRGMGHSACAEELEDFVDFIRSHVHT